MNLCQWITKITISLCTLLCVFTLSCFSAPFVDTQSSTNKKLKDVTSEISQTKSALKTVNKKRMALEKKLKKSDLSISLVTKKIQKNKKSKRNIENSLLELQKTKNTLLTNKKHQESLLAKQLRAAYSAGHHDYIKLLLNQENPASIQRTITQYQYINNARITEIESFKQTIKELALIEEQQNIQSITLNKVTLQLTSDKASLEKNKAQRTTTLKLLKKDQLSKKQQLNKLITEEKNLLAMLKKIKSLIKSTKKLNGLAKLKRKLNWPVSGKLIHTFGSQKHGYIKWKGVLKRASLGQQVKAIYNGTVLFSDWLKGYGLVTIIDHGKGYMSLYGHNQTLLKNVGDYVEKGEPISLVGQSGGQSLPGLYFEIRHAGRAVNPRLWCK